eukprot:1157326-Pelagomonas_calceolata.AAC.5
MVEAGSALYTHACTCTHMHTHTHTHINTAHLFHKPKCEVSHRGLRVSDPHQQQRQQVGSMRPTAISADLVLLLWGGQAGTCRHNRS